MTEARRSEGTVTRDSLFRLKGGLKFKKKKNMALADKSFYADVAKGYVIKVLVDVLASALSRSVIELSETGIFLKQDNKNSSMLFDLALQRENFRQYKCDKTLYMSVNLKHLQRLIRNVKKKDSVTLFIERDDQTKLYVVIRPDSANKKTARSEKVSVTIQLLSKVDKLAELGESSYGFPMVIEASDFQKVKKMISVGRKIKIKMQGSNYLSFYCDDGGINTAELTFGEIVSPVVEKSVKKSSKKKEQSDSESEHSEKKKSKKGKKKSDSEEKETPKVSSEDIYDADFYTNMFTLLIKLPGLCSQMQFHAPTIEGYPLRIKMLAGLLGMIQVYIKDASQIEYEEERKRERDDMITGPSKSKRKSAKTK